MRLSCIACEALARPIYLCAAQSPHIVDVQLVQRGLHNRPAGLREHLQGLIDGLEGRGYDAITLGYGLCGKATAGLTARSTPLVVPRAHDCITLFLGSGERYHEQFSRHPGTFWYAQDYIERDDGSGTSLSMGSGVDTDVQALYESYVAKYGRENADYLMEVMGAWQSHYQRAVYIDMGLGGVGVEARAQDEAARRGWSFERMAGDLVLFRRLLSGEWSGDAAEQFLVVPPGQSVVMVADERIITCAAPGAG